MTLEYAEEKIKEALRQAKGNATQARQQIIAWTYEDSKLLHALARPHLTGIVAHAINRTIYNQSKPKTARPAEPEVAAPESGNETFGMDILKTIAAGNSAMFGQENVGPPVRKRQASQRHVDTLKHIASQSKTPPRKKNEGYE